MLTAEQTATQTSAVELSRAALVAVLDRAKHVVPARFPKPILTCVRLEIADGLLTVQATDGELSLFAHMPADGSLPACVVPLAELSRRLKASKHPTCSLSPSDDGERLLINGGRVEHALQTYDPAEFPVVPSQLEGDSIEVDAAELVHALNVASHGVAKEASRYAIDGILLESNEKGSRLVATDGRRLAMVELCNAGELGDQALMPHRFCRLIEKLTDRNTLDAHPPMRTLDAKVTDWEDRPMPIKYALFENNVTADPDDYMAMVQISGSAAGDDLVQDIIDQGSTVGKPDILAVTAALKLACQRRIEQGQRVNYFGMVEFFPRVKGVFTGPTDGFDPARHRIDIGANPGAELREAVRTGAKVEKVESVKPSPNPVEYRDVGSDTTNDTVTGLNIGQLSGSRLKFDPGAADEGLYFVATAGGETKVPTVQKNKPSQLVFLVPNLVDGTYHLEVRARMGSGTSARELRIGRLDATLTVLPT